jgi:transcription elongation factor Elf1
MAEAKSRSETRSRKSASGDVTFKCRLCEKQKPISEMKVITRFRPVIVICRDCEKEIQ